VPSTIELKQVRGNLRQINSSTADTGPAASCS